MDGKYFSQNILFKTYIARGRYHDKEVVAVLPWRAVYPEALDRHVRVLEVDTVGEEGLDVVKVLRLQLGHGREPVVILLYQLCHEVLIKRQLMVPCYHHLEVIGKATWGSTHTVLVLDACMITVVIG